MVYTATNDTYTLIVEPDFDPANPREDCEPFGHMLCWHRRYRLGDEHHYETPWDFLRALCAEYIDDDDTLDAMSIDSLKAVLSRQNDIVVLPLYLYDHSGLAMSTGSFVGRAVHAEWDSGQVGYIYADRDDIRKCYCEVTPETVKQAEEILQGEVQAYNAWLCGDCWGYRLYRNGDEIDSCWGFIGDIEDIRNDIAEYLPDDCQGLADELTLSYSMVYVSAL